MGWLEHIMLMPPTRRLNRFRAHGGSLAPLLFIVVALGISAAVFFLFTKKRMDAEQQQKDAVAAQAAAAAPASATPTPGGAPASSAPVAPPAPPKPAPAPVLGFARPVDVAEQLARSMSSGDLQTAAKIIAGGDATQEAGALAVLSKLKELGYKVAPPDQVQTIGQVGMAIRLGIPLLKVDGTPTDVRLQIDVQKDSKMGWKVGTLRLPKELQSALAVLPSPGPAAAGSPSPAPTVNPGGGAPIPAGGAKSLIVVDAEPDAMSFASEFVNHLLKLNYDEVNKRVDEEKVPPMKVAGLCIVFEDGDFALADSKPLVATVATETTSWIIVKVQSKALKEETEFGLELEKHAGSWRVSGLNLSKLLADNARSTANAGVPYTPLVQNPKGGESVALYYEYDSDILHARAQAQLKIIAGILKASPTRKIKIGGHTDALGAENYNLALSRKRAEAVKQFFLNEGVPLAQVETVGFGMANPLSPNANPDGSDNPEGRSRNRRAEILLDF